MAILYIHDKNGNQIPIPSIKGADGKDGVNGSDGKSSYQIWLDAGNTGIEAEFLESLKGAKGADGAKGEKGEKGDKGETGAAGSNGADGKDGSDGVSPVVSISKSGSVTTLTITDANGTKTATIHDGENGADGAKGEKGEKGDKGETGATGSNGADGKDGSDGISPVVSISKSGSVTTLTITDANGTKTATIHDGANGAVGAKGETGENGKDGERGTGILKVTTAPSSYTTATGGFTPNYRIALSTVTAQSAVSNVLVGDLVAYSYYLYPVGYVDASYVYLGARTSIRGAAGAAGADGKSAYSYAQDGGYTGTEAEFAEKLASGSLLVMMELSEDGATITPDKTVAECIAAYKNGTAVYAVIIGDTSYVGIMNTAMDSEDAAGVVFDCVDNNANNGDRLVVQGFSDGEMEIWNVSARSSFAAKKDIPTDDHINELIDAKLAEIPNASGVSF